MKLVKSLCIVSAAFASLAVSTESHAIPAFARQMGMSCNACHFQSFPALNAFGRNFKASGFTMMGSQAKIEEEGLSIPANLNMAVLAAGQFNNQSGNGTTTPIKGTTSSWPSDLSLFIAGRVSENVGALGELAMAAAPGNTGVMNSLKLPMSWDVGMARLSVVPFITGGQGPSYSFETLNTGANRIHTVMTDSGNRLQNSAIGVYSAAQYLGTGSSPGHGLGLVATSDMGYVNLTQWAPTNLSGGAGGTSTAISATYLRLVATPNVMKDWDTGFGLQVFSGGGYNDVALARRETKAWTIDAQFQGATGGMPLGVYASYGVAKANSCTVAGAIAAGTTQNLYNTGCVDKKSFNIGAKLEFVPHHWFATFGYRSGDEATGVAGTTAALASGKNNAWTLGVDYKLSQNVKFRLSETQASGSYYDAVAQRAAAPTSNTTFAVEALF